MRIKYVLFGLILLTIALGVWAASTLKFETDVSTYNLTSAESIENYRSFLSNMEIDSIEQSIIIIEKKTGWRTIEDFKTLKEITSFWKTQSEVQNVSSIVDLEYPRKGLLHSFKEPFLSLDKTKRFEKRMKDFDLYGDIIEKYISEDKKYTLVFLESPEAISKKVVDEFEKLNYSDQQIEIHFLQNDLIQQELQRYLMKDTVVLAMISLFLILAGFFFFTHSIKGIGLIALMVAFNISITFLAMYLLNMSFTMHMISIPCIITVLSFTDIMYIFFYQKELKSYCASDEELRRKILLSIKTPLLLTSLTNAIGFIVFLVLSENIHLFNYAMAAIVGITAAYFSSRFIVINLMNKSSDYLKRDNFQGIYSVHHRISQWFWKRKKASLLVFFSLNIVVIFLVVSAFEINHSENEFSISKASISNNKEVLQREFFGKKQAEIFITLNDGVVWDREILNQIESIEESLGQIFKPQYIHSPAVIVKRFSRYMNNGRAEAYTIPNKIDEWFVKQLIKNISSLGGDGFVSESSNKARIVFGYPDQDLVDTRKNYKRISQLLKEQSNSKVKYELSGLQYLSDEATYSFSNKIILGLGASILFGSILIFFLLKSIKTSIGLLLVNLFPIFVSLGLIIFFDISIAPMTLLLLSILIGVCVDDSIYLVMHKKSKPKAIHILPIFITSFVLILGFLSLSFSSFAWLQPFGWIFLIGISLAYILDVFILDMFINRTDKFSGNG